MAYPICRIGQSTPGRSSRAACITSSWSIVVECLCSAWAAVTRSHSTKGGSTTYARSYTSSWIGAACCACSNCQEKEHTSSLQQHTDNAKWSDKCESHESQYLIWALTARTYVQEITITSSMMQNPYPEAHEISHPFMELKGLLCYWRSACHWSLN